MGIIWRSAMPLLTTLAALVIIVNSAEEDLDAEYRHDLRPRILDTGTPTRNYDQPWRAMGALDPPLQEQRNIENGDNDSPEGLPKRRRNGRKRRRRPQTSSNEDLIPQERLVYAEESPRAHFNIGFDNTHQTTEIPKRRRKKPESRPIQTWTDDVVELERPTRRRGQRRKRPSLETWPELSEFRQSANSAEQVEAKAKTIDQGNMDDGREEIPQDAVQIYENKHEFTEQKPENHKLDRNQRPVAAEFTLPLNTRVEMAEDESLSEFSAEDINVNIPITTKRSNNASVIYEQVDKAQDKYLAYYKTTTDNGLSLKSNRVHKIDMADNETARFSLERQKSNEKVQDSINEPHMRELQIRRIKLMVGKCKDKLQQHRTRTLKDGQPVLWMDKIVMDSYLMDPLTLKDILKRSNGTSLSEILQQHNLSLTDLLHGKQHAVSIFKSHDSLEVRNSNPSEPRNDIFEVKQDLQDKESEEPLIKVETKYATEPSVEYSTPIEVQTEDNKTYDDAPTTTIKPLEKTPKISTRRRVPLGIRKKLRMRPLLNDTYKGQLSRDLVSLNSRKYSHHRRNIAKGKEWKDVIPSMIQNNTLVENNNGVERETTTIAVILEETTIPIEIVTNNNSSEEKISEENENSKLDDINMDTTEIVFTTTKEIPTELPQAVTEKPTTPSALRPMNSSGLRRQAFNNRLKRKRLKYKNATTQPPEDDIIKHLFGLGTLVSSSEFIARTQEPKSTEEDTNDLTTVDGFITTESTHRTENGPIQSTTRIMAPVTSMPSTTEETAKIEIEEILNDTRTSAKLSKILMERNMTLSELVEHRERGSSHVHLADIFHNASREPNPPEPFLSKSLLEPISKETYPLRALLDANLHDPNVKVTTVDPSIISNVNIPVVMDFGNNVNENAENMGIMSLFNNFTNPSNKSTLMKDSEGRTYKTSIVAVNITNTITTTEPVRESRVLSESQDDVVSWNEIFSLMGKNHDHDNDTSSNNIEGLSMKPFKKIRLDEDADGDGLIVLEDLQHLKVFENNIAIDSDEKIEVNAHDNKESTPAPGILDKIPSQTKSVTVATASIAGLAMILFLLTYATFKWKQQRSAIRKKRSFRDERIPTPVFENRKGHKHNSSTRSISPMLQTSNIYTLNTLDSQNGKDSPDYMWDSLRKPFQ